MATRLGHAVYLNFDDYPMFVDIAAQFAAEIEAVRSDNQGIEF